MDKPDASFVHPEPVEGREHGAAMTLLQRIKSALDPAGTLNPGKLGL